MAAPVLSALKLGDRVELQKYDDVYLIDIEPYFQQASENLTLQVLKTDVKQTTPDNNSVTHSPLDSCSDNLISAFPSQLGSSQSHTLDELGLLSIVASGAKRKVALYESLQTAGFIKAATEYLLEDLSR